MRTNNHRLHGKLWTLFLQIVLVVWVGTRLPLFQFSFFKPDDDSDYITRDITPTGYCFAHTPRSSENGGGVAFLYRKDLKMERLKNPVFKSFEFMESLLNTTSCVLRIIVVYRPPGSTQNGSTTRGSIIGGRTFRKPPYFVPSKPQTAFVFF